MIDVITKALGCAFDCSLNAGTPHIEMIDPRNPRNGRNLEYRNNWKIISVSGIDELADVELTTEKSRYRDGVIIRGDRRRERVIKLTVQICPCDDCDIYEQRRELYDILTCKNCDEPCLKPCDDGTLCLTDYAVKDARYCIMRVRCCGVVRDTSVKFTKMTAVQRLGRCERFNIEFLAPSPYNNHPRLQSEVVTVGKESLTCPAQICGDVNLRRVNGFEKCFTVDYAGNVRSYPRIIIAGDVVNLKITNNVTGASVSFNRRESQYEIAGCGATTLNFWRGQQSYTNNRGQNIYNELEQGCNNAFFLDPQCDPIEFCITGEQVNAGSFKLRLDWWNEFDGFFSSHADSYPLSACDEIQPVFAKCEDGYTPLEDC